VASGLATAPAVRRAAFIAFGVAGIAGLVVALQTSLWLLAIGAACIAAGWFYTGGPRPYGYAGYGEAFCFVFFGLVAVEGTVYAASSHLFALGFLAACPVGLMTVALLVVNNLRDIPTDGPAGKRTLAVVLGAKRTRLLYAACVLVPFPLVGLVAISRPAALIALAALIPSVIAVKRVMKGAAGRELIPVLGMTGGLQLLFSVLLAVGIAW
jgi:1,4-dihydroxy-2-naphthoate polyprenyltransferase